MSELVAIVLKKNLGLFCQSYKTVQLYRLVYCGKIIAQEREGVVTALTDPDHHLAFYFLSLSNVKERGEVIRESAIKALG